MPNYNPAALIKRTCGKTDVYSRAIYTICNDIMGGLGPMFAIRTRNNNDILRVLMTHTKWNMILVGNVTTDEIQETNLWGDVIQLAAEGELGEERSPKLAWIKVTHQGILLQWTMNPLWSGKASQLSKRFQKALTTLTKRFNDYDSWGDLKLSPLIAE